MDQQNTGSFAAPLGGIEALKASMSQRGMDTSVLDQMSAAAPGQQVSPGSVPQTDPKAGFDQRVAGQSAQPKQPFRSAESEIATKALKSVIDTDNAIAKQSLAMNNPMGGGLA